MYHFWTWIIIVHFSKSLCEHYLLMHYGWCFCCNFSLWTFSQFSNSSDSLQYNRIFIYFAAPYSPAPFLATCVWALTGSKRVVVYISTIDLELLWKTLRSSEMISSCLLRIASIKQVNVFRLREQNWILRGKWFIKRMMKTEMRYWIACRRRTRTLWF